MNSNSRHEKIPRHESLTTAWNPLFFRHEILFPPSWNGTIRHEFALLVRNEFKLSSWKISPSWITHDVMKSIFFHHQILFPPSWIGTIRHESILSSNHESFSWMHPSCTRSLIKHYTRVHRHNTKPYRDFQCLFSLVYKRNSFLYSASSHPWA